MSADTVEIVLVLVVRLSLAVGVFSVAMGLARAFRRLDKLEREKEKSDD